MLKFSCLLSCFFLCSTTNYLIQKENYFYSNGFKIKPYGSEIVKYGQVVKHPEEIKRNFWLNVYMTGNVLNYWVLTLSEQKESKEDIIKTFLGDKAPSCFAEEWGDTKANIDHDLDQMTEQYEPEIAFKQILTNWLQSTQGWALFRKIFLQTDNFISELEDNLQVVLRRNGGIFQVPFIATNWQRTGWKISEAARIIPRKVKYKIVKNIYYTSIVKPERGQIIEKLFPPLIFVEIPRNHSHKVADNIGRIRDALQYALSLNEDQIKYVTVSQEEASNKVLYSKFEKLFPLKLKIDFYSSLVPTKILLLEFPFRFFCFTP